MNDKQIELARRHAHLVNQIAYQRSQLSIAVESLHTPLRIADKGVRVYRYLTRKPVLLAGVAALVAAARPKRWLLILENGLLVWQLFAAVKRGFK
jgi:hypothetical protein